MRSAAGETIQLARNQHGTYTTSVQINGALVLPFFLDTGASLVVIPEDVFRTLTRTGTVTKNDFIGTGTAILADGSEHASESYVLHEVQVGDHIVRNVVASVVPVKWRRFARSKLSLEIARLVHRKHPAGACDCRRSWCDAEHPCRIYNHPCLAGVKPIRCNRLGREYRQTRLEFESGHTSTRCRGGTRRVCATGCK
jgi:hypothetical protein